MQYLTCIKCHSSYDDEEHLPRLLQECGHTLCHSCIQSHNGIISCPQDDTQYNQNIEEYPLNAALLKLAIQQKRKGKLDTKTSQLKTPTKIDELLTPSELLTNTNTNTKSFDNLIQNTSPRNSYSQIKQRLVQQITNKINDIIAQLQLRQQKLWKELDDLLIKHGPNIDYSTLNIDFQQQVETIIPRYGQIRYELGQFATFSEIQKSPQKCKRIFDQSPIKSLFQVKQKSQLQFIIENLKSNNNLEEIILKREDIGNDEVLQFSQALKISQSYIRNINLSKNRISDLGFIALIDSLWFNRTVKQINIKYNSITNVSLDYLINSYNAQKHNQLQQIKVRGNQIRGEEFVNILKKVGILVYL